MPSPFRFAGLLLVCVLWMGVGPAVAQGGPRPYQAALDLRAGLSLRSDDVDSRGVRAEARGMTPTSFAGGARAFVPGHAFGAAVQGRYERFGLEPQGGAETRSLRTWDGELAALLLGRAAVRSRVELQGGLGYGAAWVPVARFADPAAPMPVLDAVRVALHGPVVEARAALAVTPALSAELGARARPQSFGARHEGTLLSLRTIAGNVGVVFGWLETGGVQLAGLASYEWAHTAGGHGTPSLSQAQHRFAVGLRAQVGERVSSRRPEASGRRPPVLRGTVRSGGDAIRGATVSTEQGARTVTAADGSFSFADAKAGLVRVRVEAPGFVPSDDVVSVDADADTQVHLQLQRPEAPAALTGLVRDVDGKRADGVVVTVVERRVSAPLDARGGFRLQVPPGSYTLLIEAPGFVAQRKSVRVGAGEQSIHNIDLRRER